MIPPSNFTLSYLCQWQQINDTWFSKPCSVIIKEQNVTVYSYVYVDKRNMYTTLTCNKRAEEFLTLKEAQDFCDKEERKLKKILIRKAANLFKWS